MSNADLSKVIEEIREQIEFSLGQGPVFLDIDTISALLDAAEECERLEEQLSYEQDRNRMNVANADLQLKELRLTSTNEAAQRILSAPVVEATAVTYYRMAYDYWEDMVPWESIDDEHKADCIRKTKKILRTALKAAEETDVGCPCRLKAELAQAKREAMSLAVATAAETAILLRDEIAGEIEEIVNEIEGATIDNLDAEDVLSVDATVEKLYSLLPTIAQRVREGKVGG